MSILVTGSSWMLTALATPALAAPFTDPRDGLVLTPPPGFQVRLGNSDSDDELAIALERDEESTCIAVLVKQAKVEHPSLSELTREAHDGIGTLAALGPTTALQVGPALGVMASGTSSIAEVHAQVHVALLAFPAGRILVTCTLPPGEPFAPAFRAIAESIHFAR